MPEPEHRRWMRPSWASDTLKRQTEARISIGRVGSGLLTASSQRFLLDHARARDAVWSEADFRGMAQHLSETGVRSVEVASLAPDRSTYVRRPDLGRQLSPLAREFLQASASKSCDLAIVVADGLSACAVEQNATALAVSLVRHFEGEGTRLAPVVLCRGGRVAIGDEVAALLDARIVIVLIGERPGLSAADSLEAYITYEAKVGTPDSRRQCISNIRRRGQSIEAATTIIADLVPRMFRARTSGVGLPAVEGGNAQLIDGGDNK